MTQEDVLPLQAGPVSIGPVRNSIAYYSETGTEGEYFLYECRDGSGWDSYIPTGLLIYHVDRSTAHRVGGISAYEQWTDWPYSNAINAYGDHPCFYVVPAADQQNLHYPGGTGSMVFPGSEDIHSFIPVDWSGKNPSGIRLSGIQYAGGNVQFNMSFSQSRLLSGRVEDLSGKGIPGVFVQLSTLASAPTSSGPRKISPRRIDFEAVTDANGDFFLSLEGFDETAGHVTLSKTGYQTTGYNVELARQVNHAEFTLHRNDQGILFNYAYYDPGADVFVWGDGKSNSLMAAIRIPAEEITTRGVLQSISFTPQWDAERFYAIVDRNGERLLTAEIPPTPAGDNCTADLSGHNLVIEPGSDVYIGYAFENAHPGAGFDGYLFQITSGGNNCHRSPFSLDSSSWYSSISSYGLVLDVRIAEILEGGEDPVEPGTLAQMGIPSIADPSCGHYAVGSSFQLQLDLPEGMTPAAEEVWLFDGAPVTGAKSVTLTAGKHVVTARVKWPDGSQETMALQIDVK